MELLICSLWGFGLFGALFGACTTLTNFLFDQEMDDTLTPGSH
jgi:hypothetical protein